MRIVILVPLLFLLVSSHVVRAADPARAPARFGRISIGLINDIDCVRRARINILVNDALIEREDSEPTAAIQAAGSFLQEPLSDEARVRGKDIFLIPALPDEARQPQREEPNSGTFDGMLLAQAG